MGGSALTVPPEIIVFYGVIRTFYPIYVNDGSLAHFICFVEKSITSHYPSYEKTMFFKTKETVFRTGRIHGTRFAIDWRNIVPVDFNEGT
jgi:hypothetical protein